MSLALYEITDDHVLIVTDTLSVVYDDDGLAVPAALDRSKCVVYPEQDAAVVTLGNWQFAIAWNAWLRSIEWTDVEQLDEIAPANLRLLAARAAEAGVDVTGTVTHFGFSPRRDAYVGFMYDADADYASETLTRRFGYAPAPFPVRTAPGADLEEWIDLACRIKAAERDLIYAGERGARIGGELVLTGLGVGPILSGRIHRFDDYDDDLAAINAR